jgi:hypothetical protein
MSGIFEHPEGNTSSVPIVVAVPIIIAVPVIDAVPVIVAVPGIISHIGAEERVNYPSSKYSGD